MKTLIKEEYYGASERHDLPLQYNNESITIMMQNQLVSRFAKNGTCRHQFCCQRYITEVPVRYSSRQLKKSRTNRRTDIASSCLPGGLPVPQNEFN